MSYGRGLLFFSGGAEGCRSDCTELINALAKMGELACDGQALTVCCPKNLENWRPRAKRFCCSCKFCTPALVTSCVANTDVSILDSETFPNSTSFKGSYAIKSEA